MNSAQFRNALQYVKILARKPRVKMEDPGEWHKSLIDPTGFYLDAFRFFYFNLPPVIRQHKYYFGKKSRGFGEKAFHSMWTALYRKYRFQNFLEIGIYRGQTISLIGLLSKTFFKESTVNGISPFDHSGDIVSKYLQMDYIDDINANFKNFNLQAPSLTKAYSTDAEAVKIIQSKQWDCIYIDGSHDYEIAKKDWIACSANVRVGGLIVMDDSALYTNYKEPFFAFKGHPGPSQVADEIKEDGNFREILRVGHNRVFERVQ